MESVWHNNSLTGNASVEIAVLDSCLARAAMDALFFNLADGYDFIEESLSPLDPGALMSDTCPAPYHGTMMASIVAAGPTLCLASSPCSPTSRCFLFAS